MAALRNFDVVPNELPEPPYPSDLRAKGFTLHVDWELIRQSKSWMLCPPEMRPWLFLLWCNSWTNSPAGTYEADDELIAASIGMEYRLFMAHRDQLMRGWVRHSDGRLYHDYITTLVLEMAGRRVKDKTRMAEYRAKVKGGTYERGGTSADSDVTRDSRVTNANVRVSNTTGTGTGTVQEQEREQKKHFRTTPTPPAPPAPPPPPAPTPPAAPAAAPRKRAAQPSATANVSVSDLVSMGVDRQHAEDWLRVRRLKKLPLTQTAFRAVRAEAERACITLAQAIQASSEHGWAGFKAAWYEKEVLGGGAAPAGNVHNLNFSPSGRLLNKQERLEASNSAVADEWLAQQGITPGDTIDE